jgi:hypothetical protein
MEKQVYEIPVDIMADAARIILQGGLEHRIVDAGLETVKLEILIPESKFKSRQSLEELINDYNFYRYADSE